MNNMSEISDEEFVPFLRNLGVETYNKSFEWMLNDPSFSGILRWLYKNLDHNNALNSREEYRYIEIEKKSGLLSIEDLESSIAAIKDDYPGICVPGDHESKEDVELDVVMQRERLNVLEKQEMVLQDLIKQNESIKEELTLELARLSAGHHQSVNDEQSLAEECTGLAQELETITDGVIDVIADNLEVYTSCKGDKDVASRFFAYASLESYRQMQSLFRSHFDLFVSKNLVNRQNNVTDEELRTTLLEAKNMEERLSDAAFAYLDSKAELSGEQAKLALVSNYSNVHPSQIASVLMETQSALELLEQEENILEEEMQSAVASLVQNRTSLAANIAASAAIAVRQQMLSSLTQLVDVWQQALSLDRLLYQCLRHELRTAEEFVSFATQLSEYVRADNNAVVSRMASMTEICSDHESRELKLPSNQIVDVLFAMLGAEGNDASILVKLYNELKANTQELKGSVDQGFKRRENALMEMKKLSKPLRDHIWDGCTKQPNCWDRKVATLTHTLSQNMAAVEKRVLEASSLFTNVKNGDKQNLRKLWQWFLTDPSKLHAAIKNARNY